MKTRRALGPSLSLACLVLIAGLAACRSTPIPPGPTPAPTRPGTELGGLAFIRDADVWLADVNGGNLHPLTVDGTSSRPYGYARWSPDGSRLAFVSHDLQSGLSRLLMAGLDGTVVLIAEDVAAGTPPAWSSSGGQLAYVADRKRQTEDGHAIYVLRTVDLTQRQMRDVGNLAFSGDCDGALSDPADELYATEMGSTGSDQIDRRPTLIWTASGDFVLDQSCTLTGLVWMSGKDGRMVVLNDRWTSAALSPDGQRLALIEETPGPASGSTRTLMITNADGGDARPVTTGDDPVAPGWSPDATTVYYTTRDLQQTMRLTDAQAQAAGLQESPASFSVYQSRIRRARLDGSSPETILEAAAHGLTNPTFSRSGSRLVYGMVANSTDLFGSIRAGTTGDALKSKFPTVRLESISLTGPASGFVLFENSGQPAFAGPSAVPIAEVTLTLPTVTVAASPTDTAAPPTDTASPEPTQTAKATATPSRSAPVRTLPPTRLLPSSTPPPVYFTVVPSPTPKRTATRTPRATKTQAPATSTRPSAATATSEVLPTIETIEAPPSATSIPPSDTPQPPPDTAEPPTDTPEPPEETVVPPPDTPEPAVETVVLATSKFVSLQVAGGWEQLLRIR